RQQEEHEDRIKREQASQPKQPQPQAATPQAPQTAVVTGNGQPTSCSDISGLGSPRLALSYNCKKASQRIRCAAGGNCLGDAKWTKAEPYNHGPSIITFQPFQGAAIVIPAGESLWSVPDNTSRGRHLEARPWSKEPKTVKECAQENTSATVREFEVALRCELERQLAQDEEIATRKEYPQYMAFSACEPPSKRRITAGWEQRSLDYCKAHPNEPIGWCDIPARDNRTDSHPLREPDWLSDSDCRKLDDIMLL